MAKGSVIQPGRRSFWLAFIFLGFFAIAVVLAHRFEAMIALAKVGSTRGSFGSLVAALSIYYGDHQGNIPPRLDDPEFLQKYLGGHLPEIRLDKAGHAGSSAFETYPFTDPTGILDPTKLRDTGHWLYDPAHGTLALDCTHPDRHGRPWYQSCSSSPLIAGIISRTPTPKSR